MNYANLLKDSILYIPSKILPALTGMFFIGYLFRNLSAPEYVAYSIIASTCLIAAQLGAGWIGNAILFYLPRNAHDKGAFLTDALRVLLLAAIFSMVCGMAAILGMAAPGLPAYISAAALIAGQVAFYALTSVFQSERQIKMQQSAVFIQCLSQFGTLIAFFWLGKGSTTVAVSCFASGFALAAIYYIVRIKSSFGVKLSDALQLSAIWRNENAKKMFRYGAPLCLWFCAVLFINSVDRFFLESLDAQGAVASYLSTKDLMIGASGLMTMPLLIASHPLILRLFSENQNVAASHVIRNNIRLVTCMFVGYATVLQFFGVFLLKAIFGDKYQTEIDILLIVTIGIFFSCAAMYAQKGLEVCGKTALMAALALAAAVVALVAMTILVPVYQLHGAAMAFSFAQCVYFASAALISHKHLKVIVHVRDLIWPALIWVSGWLVHMGITNAIPGAASHILWLMLYLLVLVTGGFIYFKSPVNILRLRKQRASGRASLNDEGSKNLVE